MEYPFPLLATYNHMSRGQLGQEYANIEQQFGRREHLPAPFYNRPDAQNDHQRAAMHMDFLQERIANHAQYQAEWRANVGHMKKQDGASPPLVTTSHWTRLDAIRHH